MTDKQDDKNIDEFAKRVGTMSGDELDKLLREQGDDPAAVKASMAAAFDRIRVFYEELVADESRDEEDGWPTLALAAASRAEQGSPTESPYILVTNGGRVRIWEWASRGGFYLQASQVPSGATSVRVRAVSFPLEEEPSDPRWCRVLGCSAQFLGKGRDKDGIEASF